MTSVTIGRTHQLTINPYASQYLGLGGIALGRTTNEVSVVEPFLEAYVHHESGGNFGSVSTFQWQFGGATREHIAALSEVKDDWIRLNTFEDDWDECGALAPTVEAKSTAWLLLEGSWNNAVSLGKSWIVPIAVLPTPEGGALLEWENPTDAIEVLINQWGQCRVLLLQDGEISSSTPNDEVWRITRVEEAISQIAFSPL